MGEVRLPTTATGLASTLLYVALGTLSGCESNADLGSNLADDGGHPRDSSTRPEGSPEASPEAAKDGVAPSTDTGSDAGCSDGAAATSSWVETPIPNSLADVEGGAPNPESYTDNSDGTVTDNVTGLMWQQSVATTMFVQADAVTYCSDLVLAGYADWRLPSISELVSLLDYGQAALLINPTYFPATPTSTFWSSTTKPTSPPSAGVVNFGFGPVTGPVSSEFCARCVR
jgi:Protein of unknown function (DUF1566)